MSIRGKWDFLESFKDWGSSLNYWTERWIPDSWVICVILTAIAYGMTLIWGSATPLQAVEAWGKGLWVLLALAMQFSIAMIAAYACAVSKPMSKMLNRVSSWPNPDKPWQAIGIMAIISLFSAWLNWALSLVLSSIFIPFVMKNNPRVDYRLLVTTAYLGLGTVWHAGLSASAPLILATPDNFLIKAGVVHELIPTTRTILSWFNILYVIFISLVSGLVIIALTPKAEKAFLLQPERVKGLISFQPVEKPKDSLTPAMRMEWWPGWNLLVAMLMLLTLISQLKRLGFGLGWTIDAYNCTFLFLGLVLHWYPKPFLEACREGVKNTWGIILQFPFYAGIFGLVNFTNLGEFLSRFFSSLGSSSSFPLLVYWYSALLNYFVPSGGSKWAIEAPYLIQAGQNFGISIPTITLAYAYGDMTTNLIQPFWAIPILSVTNLKFGDIMGYCMIVCLVCALVTSLAMLIMPLIL